jgi:signal transduction histidine kinase
MSADVLRAYELPERAANVVARIRRSAERMGRMISDLMDYSQGQVGGGIPIAPQETDMADIGRRTIDEIEVLDRRVRLSVAGDTSGRWDPDRAAQVVGNLVGNALQHGTGDIDVSVSGEADRVQLRVSNGGDPIPAELLSRVTQPFARGSDHGSGQGLGLGLYIVHEIVRAHGGELQIESDARSGTHVTISWPRQRPAT